MVKQSSSFTFGSRPPIEGTGARRFFSELSTTFLVVLALLILSILAWLGLMAASQIVHKQNATLLGEVTSIKNDSALAVNLKNLTDFQAAVTQTHQVFASQIFLSQVLGFLEQSTHRQVRWATLTFETTTKSDTSDLKDEEKKVLAVLTAKGGLTIKELQEATALVDVSGPLGVLLKGKKVQLVGGKYVAFSALPGALTLTGSAASYRALAEQMVAFMNLREAVSQLSVRQIVVSTEGGVSFVMQIQLKPDVLLRAAPSKSAESANPN